ncbi:MAG: DHHA1 domain-containing protein [Conexivisphaerales archaeon]
MPKFILISHRKDLDGISSAALGVRYAAKHMVSPFYLALKDYSDEMQIIEDRILGIENCEVLISDLATDQKFIDSIFSRLSIIKSNKNKVTWMDHHPTKDFIKEKLASIIDVLDLRPSDTTGSQIVYDRIYAKNGIKDEHAEMLARLGRDSDLMELKYDITPKLVSLIDYYNYIDSDTILYPNLVQLTLSLAFPKVEAEEDRLLEEHHLKQIEFYESLKLSEKDKVLGNVERVKVGSYTFAIFSYPNLISGTQISNYVLEANDVDASIGFNEKGSGSVRRNNDNISCRSIAAMLGGGGHEFAAGFNLGFEIKSDEDAKRARATIKEALKKVYGK